MKSVSPKFGAADFAGQGNEVGDRRVVPMKTCIEAGYLRDLWQMFTDRLNRRQILRLMQGGERYQATKFSEDLGCHHHWNRIPWAAVHDAVPDPYHSRTAIREPKPLCQNFDRFAGVADLRLGLFIYEIPALGVPSEDP
jgi:hypothetical protein